MASKTEIANRALSKLGQGRVTNVDTENVKAAKVIRYMWDTVRDAMLASYPWNFAVRRTSLAPAASDPAWGYDYQYQLPSDYLSLIEIRYNPDYRIESDGSGNVVILTDEGPTLYIKYISRVTNTGEFSPMFIEALSARLAYEACEEITQSNTKKDIFFQEYRNVIDAAYRSDAIENPPDALPEDEWLTARA